MPSPRRRRIALAVLVAHVVGTIVARWRGYRVGANLVVRCRQGHLFTTIWIPGVSFKSVRLGWWRFQRCPVGDHWSLVSPVKETELPEDERRAARAVTDVRLP
ncbi:MAG TPA: hypothetical protein VEH52_00755 [Gaiellaceae bacterium]|jgi:hypothetical protein|nr:hypothetical protein [Gaiellaceae bacterium]